MRKHTYGGVLECLWCGFHNITTNHTKALYHVTKVKILGVNVSLYVANIPYSWLTRYRSILKTNRGKNSSKIALKNKSFKISTNFRRPAARSCLRRSIKSILIHPRSLPPSPCSVPVPHFKLIVRKNPIPSTRPWRLCEAFFLSWWQRRNLLEQRGGCGHGHCKLVSCRVHSI